ncbi:UDP-Glycosyltransferase/glycogen phosphorylase [Neoconidiobolus thromboides FSU 785]|nr:UDP-Glycosyltransferase/glycogen phosphorylase [Neoconidiobolus thromboides FSU 785]
MGGKSHIRLHLEIGKELKRRGHKVSYASSTDQIGWADSYNFTKINLGPNPVSDELHSRVIKALTKQTLAYSTLSLFSYAGLELSYKMVYNGLKKQFEEEKPDLVICDFLLVACFDIASKMNITYAGSFPSLGFIDQTSASYITNRFEMLPPTTRDLSFKDKLMSTLYTPLAKKILHLTIGFQLNKIRKELGVPPSFGNAWQKLDHTMIFVDTFFGFDSARPLSPLVQTIGPIIPNEYPKLNDELLNFYKHKSKVIYIAFGTIVRLEEEQIKTIMESILVLLDSKIIDGVIWPIGNTMLNLSTIKIQYKNQLLSWDQILTIKTSIKILNYAPQIAILEHPSTILFVSHCGIESTFEGLYSGIPFLAIPFFGDQLINAANLVSNGVALAVHHSELDNKEIVINSIVNIIQDKNNQFRQKVFKMKQITYASSFNKYSTVDLIERIMFLSFTSLPNENPLQHLVTNKIIITMSTLSKYSSNVQFKRFTPQIILRWAPSLARWGAVAGIGLLFLGEGIPLVRQDILSKIPIAGGLWRLPTPPSEEE